jgi:hypothetical protein
MKPFLLSGVQGLGVEQVEQNWTNFRLLGKCFFWGIFFEFIVGAQTFGLFFLR